MKKLLAIVTISFVLAFSVNAAESPITNEKAIEKLHEFFGLLDIQVYDKENLSKIVTPDFRIFEVGNDFNLDSFDSFIDGASETLDETKWELSNFVVSIDNKSAHISYFNKGSFNKGSLSNIDCKDKSTVDISITVVHCGPDHVPNIDKHTLPKPDL